MIIWLKIAFQYAPLKCSKTLKIYGFLTPFKKQLPGNQFTVISQNHCNSAVTFACASSGELLIYRKEEWKKTLIHELFHSFCLDFSMSNYDKLKKNIKKLYNI